MIPSNIKITISSVKNTEQKRISFLCERQNPFVQEGFWPQQFHFNVAISCSVINFLSNSNSSNNSLTTKVNYRNYFMGSIPWFYGETSFIRYLLDIPCISLKNPYFKISSECSLNHKNNKYNYGFLPQRSRKLKNQKKSRKKKISYIIIYFNVLWPFSEPFHISSTNHPSLEKQVWETHTQISCWANESYSLISKNYTIYSGNL